MNIHPFYTIKKCGVSKVVLFFGQKKIIFLFRNVALN